MSTTLDVTSAGANQEMLHTTRLTSLGVTLFSSRESIHLGSDGRSFRLIGQQAYFPQLWRWRQLTGEGEVTEDHCGAQYRIAFFGELMEQTTRVTPPGLAFVQITPFARADVLLQRQGVD